MLLSIPMLPSLDLMLLLGNGTRSVGNGVCVYVEREREGWREREREREGGREREREGGREGEGEREREREGERDVYM